MFRFFSSRFKIEKSKEKTARVVLFREFNIMNCFTLEASFLGYFNKKRITKDFLPHYYEKMGRKLGVALYEYVMIGEEDEKLREVKLMQQMRKGSNSKLATVTKKKLDKNKMKEIFSKMN
jgi:hypothetical protein